MSNLVFVRESEPKTTSLAIADGTQNKHATVIKLVRKYHDDLSEFGFLGFEIQKNRGSQGAQTEYAILNEQQTTLLFTYMRNTDIMRKFKKALVNAHKSTVNATAKATLSAIIDDRSAELGYPPEAMKDKQLSLV